MGGGGKVLLAGGMRSLGGSSYDDMWKICQRLREERMCVEYAIHGTDFLSRSL